LRISRRNWLTGGIAFGSARLIGTAMAQGNHRPDAVPALRGSRQSVTIPTHEYAGDIEERLDFPGDWEIHAMKMAGHDAPALSPEDIVRRLASPVGSRPLSEIAAGKKTAVITFDDLTRPTPIASVAPLVVDQLKAAGLTEANIFFLGSFGAHRTMEQDEVVKKLGSRLVQRHAWFNHNAFDGLAELGETSGKNRVWVNKLFLEADLRITISGVKIHSIAGYGGGAKAVLPGVSGFQTIHHNHMVIGKNNKTAGEAKIFKNELRRDMAEAARLAKVDFSVQIVYNNRLQPCRIVAGDVVEAHAEACRAANKLHRTATFMGADVVVANGYPQNSQGTKVQAWINRSVREAGTGILVLQHPVGMMSWHYLYPRYSGKGDPLAVLTPRSAAARKYQLIVYSQYMQKAQESMFPPGAIFATRWEEVVNALLARHKTASRVAVYPYGCLQHTEVDLDG
jgi:nickel-dependent lactate racemase